MTTKNDGLAKVGDGFAEVSMAVLDPERSIDLAALTEELGDDASSLGMALFTRVKMPAGGGRVWEIDDADDPDNPEAVATIEGVVVAHQSVNAYWATDMEDEGGGAPDCSAPDGVNAFGKRGDIDEVAGAHNCKDCPLNEFGSSPSGGKACKNMKHLYVLREGDIMPLLIVLPPSSIKAWQVYLTKSVLLKRRRSYGVLTRIGLEKARSAGGQDYSRAVFSYGGQLDPATTEAMGQFGEELSTVLIAHTPAIIAGGAAVVESEEAPF